MVTAGRISVLPDDVIDQIAAGEVVDRPASVVKELVENALDAKARHITVEIERGGKALIRVIDDGIGMSPAEARLALGRHATSKLRRLDDLFSLDTMGFRGEALPSIASVSSLTLTTRSRDSQAGTRLVVEAGRLVDQSEIGAAVGTVIEIRDLLGNVPARLKFLKGDPTETAHVSEVVSKLAMAHPGVHVQLRSGGRKSIDAPPHPSGFERARCLLGARFSGRLHPAQGEENRVVIEAYLAAPELAQSTARGLQLYVGRRAVRDRGLLHAVVMGYGELIPKGRYPVAVLFVDVPADTVDVNVHPQKLEVRFADAQEVYAAVRHTVARAVAGAPWLDQAAGGEASPVRMEAIASAAPLPRASEVALGYARHRERMLLPLGAGGRPAAPWRAPEAAHGSRVSEPAVRDGGARPVPAGEARGVAAAGPEGADPVPAGEPRVAAISAGHREPSGHGVMPPLPGEVSSPAPQRRWAAATQPEPARASSALSCAPSRAAAEPGGSGFFRCLRYLGQLDKTYLLCEALGELILIDQHAAHERVAFQRLRERHALRAIPVQRLLFPQKLELAAAEAAVADDARAELVAVGFEIEPFGGGTVVVKAVPAGLRAGAADEVLRELLAELAERGGSRAVEERIDHVLATIACHSVVRAGDPLSEREVAALLASLDEVDYKAHCPHGRPVLLRISVAEIARRFGRT
jgi:DNA mismatch repair protein MutL